jgi:hypothetical protein
MVWRCTVQTMTASQNYSQNSRRSYTEIILVEPQLHLHIFIYLFSFIWDVSGGKVNILGGHNISYSKQKLVYVCMCPLPNCFRDTAIWLYKNSNLAPNSVFHARMWVGVKRQLAVVTVDSDTVGVFWKMPHIFTNASYVDMLYVYGLCDGSATAAVEEYRRWFHMRRIQDRSVFSKCSIHCVNVVGFPVLMFHLNAHFNNMWRERKTFLKWYRLGLLPAHDDFQHVSVFLEHVYG